MPACALSRLCCGRASSHLIKLLLLLLQTCPGFQNVQSLCLLPLASPPVETPVLAWGQ